MSEYDLLLIPRKGYVPTELDHEAIDYLCNEWDYGYSPCNR